MFNHQVLPAFDDLMIMRDRTNQPAKQLKKITIQIIDYVRISIIFILWYAGFRIRSVINRILIQPLRTNRIRIRIQPLRTIRIQPLRTKGSG